MFRSFERLGSLPAFNGGWPKVEISETAGDIKVTAEIPGVEEKDLEILLDDDVLTLRGEKRAESGAKERQFSERHYGRFERRIPLGYEVGPDKIDARFRNGVLTVVLPKSERAQSRVKRIAIKHWQIAETLAARFRGAANCRGVTDEWRARNGTA